MTDSKPKIILQQWRHKNDVNGNPRRLWVSWNMEGDIVEVYEENYSGAPKCEGFDVIQISPVDVTPGEYQSTKRFAKDKHIYVAG